MSDWPDRMLWLDLETTGLDPATEMILEVGAIITTTDGDELWSGSWVVHQPGLTMARLASLPKVVREMHTTSGLLAELTTTATAPMPSVAHHLTSALREHCGIPGQTVPGEAFILAGNGVDHMERAWLNHDHGLGALLRWCTYWSIDPSVIRRSWKLWGVRTPPRGDVAHRALDDCRQALREWLNLRHETRVLADEAAPAMLRAEP